MPNSEARRMIMRGLRDGAAYDKINFQVSSFEVVAAGLRQVHDAIAARRIRVLHDRYIGRRMIYQPDLDRFVTPVDRAGGDPLIRALIVHEGIHAFCDLSNAHWMEIQTSEAAAFIAQSLFYLIITRGRDGRIRDADTHQDRLFERAWAVAQKLDRREVPTWGEYEAVREAVAQVPTYAARMGSPVGYNGVRPPERQVSLTGVAPRSSTVIPATGPRRQNLLRLV